MKSKSTICIVFLALLVTPHFTEAGLFDGIGNLVGGLVGGIVDILASIPRGIANLLKGLLGSSKSGNFIELHSNLRILITKLPSEIRSGGPKVTIATIHTVLELISNLIATISKGKTTGVVDVLIDIRDIILILQQNVQNAGAKAIFGNIYIQLSILLNNVQSSTVTVGASQFVGILKGVTISLQAVIKGLESNSVTGGLSGERDLLQNIFYTFNLLQVRGQSSSAITVLLQQLSFLLDGLELTTTNQTTRNILHSISINLSLMLNSKVSFTGVDILNFIKIAANSLNNSFNLSGITGAADFIGSTSTPTQYLQQISVVLNNLKLSIGSNDIGAVQSLIVKLVNLLSGLQSVSTSTSNLNTLSTLILNLHDVTQKLSNNSISIGQIGSLISNVLNTLNTNFDLGSVSGGGGGIVTGSITIQLQNVFSLFQQLQTMISSGGTSGVSSLLQTILAQLQSMQSSAPSTIINLIGTITAQVNNMQQQVQMGNFNGILSFIQNITNTLNQISTSVGQGENGGDITGGTVTGSVTVQLQNVFTLLNQLQSIASSGNTSSISTLLQTILNQLQSLQAQAPSSITNLLFNITSKISNLKQQVQTGSFDISGIFNVIQNINNSLNQISTTIGGGNNGGDIGGGNTGGIVTGSVTIQLQNVFTLLNQLQTIASSGNTSGISTLLQTILAQLQSLQSQAPSSITNLLFNITSKITNLQQQVQTGSFDINTILNFVQNISSTLNQVSTTIGGGNTGGGNTGGGSTTVEINKIQGLLQNFQTVIASGNTSGISALLNSFLQQLTKLQSDIKVAGSRDVIVALIGNIYTLQQSLQAGGADMSSLQFFIKNIQEGLQKIASIESSGGSSSGGGGSGGVSITNADISNVQSLFTNLQNIFNSGSLQGASPVLQSLVSTLQGFSAKVSDNNAQQILGSIIQSLTQLQQQASSGNVDMNSFANLLVQSVNKLNQFIQVVNSLQVSGQNQVSVSQGGSGGQGNGGGFNWSFQTSPTFTIGA